MWEYLYALWVNTYGVFFQKLGMLTLGDIDKIGGKLDGLTAIVTGPTSGIGKDTAEALARKGATVILACRTTSSGEKVREKIIADAAAAGRPQPNVEVQRLDLSSLASVRSFASSWDSTKRPLHILVNNAGIYALAQPRAATEDGFESHMGSNHLGHFLLTLMLVPCLRAGASAAPTFGARIVSVASSMHLLSTFGIDRKDPHLLQKFFPDKAYSQSKLAQVQFTRELRRRLEYEEERRVKGSSGSAAAKGITAFAVHPGMVLTDVVRSLPAFIRHAYRVLLGLLLLSPRQGARASVYCASAPEAPALAVATGGYFDSNCAPIQPGKIAKDADNCKWIWTWSAAETKLPTEFDLPDPDTASASVVVDSTDSTDERKKLL